MSSAYPHGGGPATRLPTAPFRALVRRLATDRQLSLAQLATELRVDRRTLQRACARQTLRPETADRLAVACGRHPCEIWPDWFGPACGRGRADGHRPA